MIPKEQRPEGTGLTKEKLEQWLKEESEATPYELHAVRGDYGATYVCTVEGNSIAATDDFGIANRIATSHNAFRPLILELIEARAEVERLTEACTQHYLRGWSDGRDRAELVCLRRRDAHDRSSVEHLEADACAEAIRAAKAVSGEPKRIVMSDDMDPTLRALVNLRDELRAKGIDFNSEKVLRELDDAYARGFANAIEAAAKECDDAAKREADRAPSRASQGLMADAFASHEKAWLAGHLARTIRSLKPAGDGGGR